MPLPIPFRHVAHGVHNSDLTGAVAFIGDLRQLAVSVETQVAGASLYTLVGSNADGFQAALPTPSQTIPLAGWSVITALNAQGMYAFDPGALGYRWVNVFRPSASSATVVFTGRT